MTFDIFARLPVDSKESTERKIIRFRVDRLRCGIDIMAVREIVVAGETAAIPNTPPYVIGAADHRDMLVPVIDMRQRFGLLPAESRNCKWIIVISSGLETALLVDSVQGVTTVSKDAERTPHPLMDGARQGWIPNVYGDEDGLIFEIDVDMITADHLMQIPKETFAKLGREDEQ